MYVFTHIISIYIHECVCLFRMFALSLSECMYRVAQSHRMTNLHRSFFAKEPYSCGSFAKIDLQLKASYESLPPCIR